MSILYIILVFIVAAVLAAITSSIGRREFPQYAQVAALVVFAVVLIVGFFGTGSLHS